MKHFIQHISAILLAAILFTGPALAAEDRTITAMDTIMTLRVPDADEALIDTCVERIRALEADLSVTLQDSSIYRLNNGETVDLSTDAHDLITYACTMNRETDGAIDITLYPVIRAWGFTTDNYRIPSSEELSSLMACVGIDHIHLNGNTVTLDPGTMIDLGSITKGYLSDVIADMLRDAGIQSAILDMGGNIFCIGGRPDGTDRRIGIADPDDSSNTAAVLTVRDQAVVTSGAYERYFIGEDGKHYGHIFDPATGAPAESGLASATIVSPNGLTCDALSTALYVMGADSASAYLASHPDIQAVLIGDDKTFYVTAGLRDRFTPVNSYQLSKIVWIDQEDVLA